MANVDDSKVNQILNHLESLHMKNDAMSTQHTALCSRMDALEQTVGSISQSDAEWKAKADAAEKEKEAEKAKADAAAKIAIDTDRAEFADAQMKADAAFQSWGKVAPHALQGESLRDYKIRLLTPFKQHSKVYKDSALSLVGDEAAFSVIADAIIADAVSASNVSAGVGMPLQKRVRKTDSGHIETRFIGDPSVVWGACMGSVTRFGRINTDMANKAR